MKQKGFPAIPQELWGQLDSLVITKRKFVFDGEYDRRKGFRPSDYAGTVPRSKTAAKRDKYAVKAYRVDGIKPFEAPGYAFRNCGLKDNLRRF
jgi:hypothetical protein